MHRVATAPHAVQPSSRTLSCTEAVAAAADNFWGASARNPHLRDPSASVHAPCVDPLRPVEPAAPSLSPCKARPRPRLARSLLTLQLARHASFTDSPASRSASSTGLSVDANAFSPSLAAPLAEAKAAAAAPYPVLPHFAAAREADTGELPKAFVCPDSRCSCFNCAKSKPFGRSGAAAEAAAPAVEVAAVRTATLGLQSASMLSANGARTSASGSEDSRRSATPPPSDGAPAERGGPGRGQGRRRHRGARRTAARAAAGSLKAQSAGPTPTSAGATSVLRASPQATVA